MGFVNKDFGQVTAPQSAQEVVLAEKLPEFGCTDDAYRRLSHGVSL
jgi:hypothetical protein